MFVLLTAILESNDFLQRETSRDEIETFYSLIPTFVSLHDCMITRERTPDWYVLIRSFSSQASESLAVSLSTSSGCKSRVRGLELRLLNYISLDSQEEELSGKWELLRKSWEKAHHPSLHPVLFLCLSFSASCRKSKEEKSKMTSSEMQSVVEEMDHTITRKRNDEFLFFQEVWWSEKGRNPMKASIALSQRRWSCLFGDLCKKKRGCLDPSHNNSNLVHSFLFVVIRSGK